MARESAGADLRVEIEGLRKFRRDIKAMDDGLPKEASAILKGAAQVVAAEARSRAPRGTGALAASIKAASAGDRALVRVGVPYAAVHEFGGTIRPRGAAITIRKRAMVYGAIAHKRADVERIILRGFDGLARRHGWN